MIGGGLGYFTRSDSLPILYGEPVSADRLVDLQGKIDTAISELGTIIYKLQLAGRHSVSVEERIEFESAIQSVAQTRLECYQIKGILVEYLSSLECINGHIVQSSAHIEDVTVHAHGFIKEFDILKLKLNDQFHSIFALENSFFFIFY